MYQPQSLHPSLGVIDSSKLNDYIQCPRFFYFRHVLGWKPQGVNHNLVFGEAIHAGLEVLYQHKFLYPEAATLAFLEVYREHFNEETDDDYGGKSPYAAAECFEAYCNEYRNEFQRYEVLELNGTKCLEVCGFTPITEHDRMYFRMDAILRDLSTGKVLCLEHKTASRGGTTWAAQWELSVQVGTYTHALYSFFPRDEVYGVKVNGLIFLKREQKFERVPCEKTFNQMLVWHEMVKNYAGKLRNELHLLCEASETLADQDVMQGFTLRPDSCIKWNRVCYYHDFCTCWPNPMQHADVTPIGFEVEHWDPQTRGKKKEKSDG